MAIGDIYESDAVEHLALTGEFDAKVWADAFVRTVGRTPELASDEETMVAWFASAIMAGYDRAHKDVAQTREEMVERMAEHCDTAVNGHRASTDGPARDYWRNRMRGALEAAADPSSRMENS